MARHKVVHHEDATTIVVAGDIHNPEPTHAIIKFPGGVVEVARCSDGTYWAHVSARPDDIPEEDRGFTVASSRVDYDFEHSQIHGIPPIPDQDHVTHFGMRFEKRKAI